MPHAFTTEADTERGVTFACATCGCRIEFVSPAYGEPNPVSDGNGGWLPPANAETWAGECNG